MEVVDKRKHSIYDKVKNHPLMTKIAGVKNLKIMIVAVIIAIGLIIYSGVESFTPTQTTYMDEEETRLANTLSQIDGVGKVNTMITRNGDEISGVLVIAEGAENISVMLKLLDATSTVMGVDKSIVEVYQME